MDHTDKKPTLAEMVAVTGLSVATISRAINEKGYVSETNIAIVRNAQKQLGYYPPKRQPNKRISNPNIILLCVPDNRSTYWLDFFSSMQEICSKRKYYPLLVYTKPTETEEVNIIKAIERMQVSGVLVVTLNASPTLCATLNRIKLPKVLCAVHAIDDINFQCNFDRVSVDSKRGIYMATNHLIAQGCKNIAYLGINTNLVNGQERLNGFLDSMHFNGLSTDDYFIRLKEDWECERNGYESVYEFHSAHRMPDGIVCLNDRAALGAILACNELGIKVPDELMLIGMDNTDVTNYVNPSLSSVDIAPYELARLATKLLFSRIDKSDSLYQNSILMPNLIVRKSSAK